jgi:hypothetical protein
MTEEGQRKVGASFVRCSLTSGFNMFQHVRERPAVRREKWHKVRGQGIIIGT